MKNVDSNFDEIFLFVDFGIRVESMWKLGLEDSSSFSPYPERPGEPDCIYFLRTGFCGYGDRCRFNHPRDRSISMVYTSILP